VGLKRIVFRGSNNLLGKLGLRLSVIAEDFDARLDQPAQLRRIFTAFGEIADAWLERQKIFPVENSFRTGEILGEFYEEFLKRPFREPGGGSRFNNLAWLYVIAKAMQPSFVIDSGTFRGASAWAFSQAGVPVYSFDIDMSRIAYRCPSVVYTERDWTSFDWKERNDLSQALIYFDDHLDQVRRLLEASRHGIPVAIFDDDFPVTSFAPMANAGDALPKIEFVLDDDLRQYREISWLHQGRRHVFALDHAYLDQARSTIADTERLPETSQITGIQQTPYRIVRVKTGSSRLEG
jgi:hypothetical protein